MKSTSPSTPVRLDKWLWAARFYKTRALAKAAIEGGKVRVNGKKGKASSTPAIGDSIRLQQGWDEKTLTVCQLSAQRQSAPIAQCLYEETPESRQKRQQHAQQRALQPSIQPASKPNKQQRRHIQQLKQSPHNAPEE